MVKQNLENDIKKLDMILYSISCEETDLIDHIVFLPFKVKFKCKNGKSWDIDENFYCGLGSYNSIKHYYIQFKNDIKKLAKIKDINNIFYFIKNSHLLYVANRLINNYDNDIVKKLHKIIIMNQACE